MIVADFRNKFMNKFMNKFINITILCQKTSLKVEFDRIYRIVPAIGRCFPSNAFHGE